MDLTMLIIVVLVSVAVGEYIMLRRILLILREVSRKKDRPSE
jgi:hypothetical protein